MRHLLRGEAAPVKLTDGRYVFAVLKWNEVDGVLPMLTGAFADLLPRRTAIHASDEDNIQYIAQLAILAKLRTSRAVPSDHYPALAYFDDLENPRSIHPVLGRPGGEIMPDVDLVGMHVQITDEPMTEQIPAIIPWLDQKTIGWLDPEIQRTMDASYPQYRFISINSFVQGRPG